MLCVTMSTRRPPQRRDTSWAGQGGGGGGQGAGSCTLFAGRQTGAAGTGRQVRLAHLQAGQQGTGVEAAALPKVVAGAKQVHPRRVALSLRQQRRLQGSASTLCRGGRAAVEDVQMPAQNRPQLDTHALPASLRLAAAPTCRKAISGSK